MRAGRPFRSVRPCKHRSPNPGIANERPTELQNSPRQAISTVPVSLPSSGASRGRNFSLGGDFWRRRYANILSPQKRLYSRLHGQITESILVILKGGCPAGRRLRTSLGPGASLPRPYGGSGASQTLRRPVHGTSGKRAALPSQSRPARYIRRRRTVDPDRVRRRREPAQVPKTVPLGVPRGNGTKWRYTFWAVPLVS